MTEDLSLRRAAREHLDAISDLVRAVEWPHRRRDCEALLALGHGWVICSGPDHDRPLGIAMWWPIGEDSARIGMVVVDPNRQGGGIGRRLMAAVMEDTAHRALTLLATAAGRPLYEKLGFQTIGANLQYQGQYQGQDQDQGEDRGSRSDPSGGIRLSQLRAARDRDRADIARLDENAVGSQRAGILAHLIEAGRAFVIGDERGIRGYAVARPFGRGEVVGPIVAESEGDAMALFSAAAAPGFIRVDIPADAADLGHHLLVHGLAMVSESPVMRRGRDPEPAGPQRIFGLATHALG